MKPAYYKAMWHNCGKCKIHYMSEEPHIRAFLCDECWFSMPHYKVSTLAAMEYINASQKPMRGPTFLWLEGEFSWTYIALYTLGCLICLATIGYYLVLK